MQKYRIQRISGNFYYVLSEDYQKTYLGILRGKLRLAEHEHPSGIPFRNLGCVGDIVMGEEEIGNGNNNKKEIKVIITEILPRKNMLLRSSPTEIHPIGSNIDYAMVIASLKQPDLRTGFIDRFLIACLTEHIEPIIFFSKCDLLNPEDQEDENLLKQSIYYLNIVKYIYWDNLLEPSNRYPVTTLLNKMHISINLPSLKDFIEQFQSGTILITGQSGTGKSTLTNKILGENIQKTKEISKATGKGRHTTTSSVLIPVKSNTKLILIDTPGVKEWGLSHLTKKQIYESYPEWKAFLGMCKFKNCEHLPSTQGCIIQEKIKEKILPEWRLHNLHHIIQSLEYYERIRPGDFKKPTGRFYNNPR